ncbi:MAG TPA: TonB C-terminal domain-containing protein, partial [Myxococcota bacterium]
MSTEREPASSTLPSSLPSSINGGDGGSISSSRPSLVLGNISLPPTSTALPHERVDVQGRFLKIACIVSVVVHAAVFAGWMLWPSSTKNAVDLDEAVIKTRLVKLGKPRDEKLLPRLPSSPPPPPADTKAPPTPDPTTPQTPVNTPTPQTPDKPSAADILEKFKNDTTKPRDINDLIKDRIGEPTDEGREDGDSEGTALDGEINASYYSRVTARIQKAMELSSVLSDDERIRLKTQLCMKIDAEGGVSDLEVKSSGSGVFDSDVLAAGRRAGTMPAPPPTARQQA